MHLLNKYLLRAYSVPGTVLGTREQRGGVLMELRLESKEANQTNVNTQAVRPTEESEAGPEG